MDFRLVICPKCGTKNLVSYVTCGITCPKCKIFLNKTDCHQDARKDYAKEMKDFCFNFEQWEKEMKKWDAENIPVDFKTVSIPDEKLLFLLEGNNA